MSPVVLRCPVSSPPASPSSGQEGEQELEQEHKGLCVLLQRWMVTAVPQESVYIYICLFI